MPTATSTACECGAPAWLSSSTWPSRERAARAAAGGSRHRIRLRAAQATGSRTSLPGSPPATARWTAGSCAGGRRSLASLESPVPVADEAAAGFAKDVDQASARHFPGDVSVKPRESPRRSSSCLTLLRRRSSSSLRGAACAPMAPMPPAGVEPATPGLGNGLSATPGHAAPRPLSGRERRNNTPSGDRQYWD
jgi:hypothetical protein